MGMLKVYRLKVYASVISLIVLLALLVFIPSVSAQTQTNPTTTLSASTEIKEDYFAANSNVNIEGTVDGDAYVAGGNVNIDGTVKGDLLVAGGNVYIRGRVLGSVRAAGGEVTIAGDVGKNLSAVGGNISVINGNIAGNFNSAGGNILISSPIQGAINVATGQLTFSPGAKVGKNINYWSDLRAQVNPGASISGQLIQHQTPKTSKQTGEGFFMAFTGASIFFKIISLISGLIMGLILIKFAPVYTQRNLDIFEKNIGQNFLAGLITLILAPILVIVLLISIVGIPLALIVGFIFLVFLYFAKIFAAIFIGQKILSYTTNKSLYLGLILGLVILGIVGFVPVLGGLFILILYLIALGTIMAEEKEFYLLLRKKAQI